MRAPEVDNLQVALFPFAFGENFLQVLFRLFNAAPVRESPARRQPVDVRVDGEGGNLEDMAHHDACRLVAHAGQGFQFLEGLRDLAAELFDECFRKVVDVHAFRVEESAWLDDFGDCIDAELDHLFRGVGRLEQDLCHLVHADVGALRAQNDRDKHRVGILVVERNGRIREEFVELLGDKLDFFGFLQNLRLLSSIASRIAAQRSFVYASRSRA